MKNVDMLIFLKNYYNAMFFFKNINMSTFSGDSAERWAVTMSPAVEKTRSLGTDVPWAVRYSLANLARRGKDCSCSLHHARGLEDKGRQSSDL